MKFTFKTIGKAAAAVGTLVGGAILALQAKKGLDDDNEFAATLADIDEAPKPEAEAEEVKMEDLPTAEAEEVKEETTEE